MADLVAAVACQRCNMPGQQKLFCQNCGLFLPDETATVERVTFTRRFFGSNLLESVLFLVTLIIGWLIWFGFSASRAQSPAKRILSIYVIDTNSGKAVSGGRMWLRDPLLKILVIGNIPLAGFVDGLFVLFDKNRQSLHDKIVGTVVVYAPYGLPEGMRNPQMAAAAMATPSPSVGSATVEPTVTPTTAPGGTTTSPQLKDVAEQLRELARLREEGIITGEEYERKRSELARQL